MDMSYSHKPVLLKAVLLFADDKGWVKLSDIGTYFREFYEDRRAAACGPGRAVRSLCPGKSICLRTAASVGSAGTWIFT